MKTIKAKITPDGEVKLLGHVEIRRTCDAILTVLDELEDVDPALLSESSLATDWERPEEDKAWAHLQ